ncbi:MAG: hypothetical protein BGO12_18555 [Verrucomicrobia bacterium 61-8]|nr:hypothetical protein [Verrucomicrobiota bacterium]OJV13553.1 MAG: hypothetical protein BGO12_18555 [Verrucomicrobia bacterium 61-8]
MKPKIFLLIASLALSILPARAADGTPVIVTNPPAPAATEEKPGYLYFKEGLITRTSKTKLDFDITLAEEIPANIDRDRTVTFWVKFDVDNNASTGRASITFPSFGKDIVCCIYKPRGTNRWQTYSSTLTLKGRKETVDLSKVKVNGNKLSFQASSQAFSGRPEMHALMSSCIGQYDDGEETSANTTDQLPRGGAFTITGD